MRLVVGYVTAMLVWYFGGFASCNVVLLDVIMQQVALMRENSFCSDTFNASYVCICDIGCYLQDEANA